MARVRSLYGRWIRASIVVTWLLALVSGALGLVALFAVVPLKELVLAFPTSKEPWRGAATIWLFLALIQAWAVFRVWTPLGRFTEMVVTRKNLAAAGIGVGVYPLAAALVVAPAMLAQLAVSGTTSPFFRPFMSPPAILINVIVLLVCYLGTLKVVASVYGVIVDRPLKAFWPILWRAGSMFALLYALFVAAVFTTLFMELAPVLAFLQYPGAVPALQSTPRAFPLVSTGFELMKFIAVPVQLLTVVTLIPFANLLVPGHAFWRAIGTLQAAGEVHLRSPKSASGPT